VTLERRSSKKRGEPVMWQNGNGGGGGDST